jgi:hypothetical protein
VGAARAMLHDQGLPINLWEFKALVEKDSGKQVKSLRRNNGGEYISNKFK